MSVAGLKMNDRDGQEGNYKNALNALVQRMSGQSMGKSDIVYENVQHDSQHQSTVTIVCLEGQQASGELCDSEKAAEQSAAYQAILGLEQSLGNLGYTLAERTLDIPASVRQAAIQAGVFTPGQNIQEALTDAAIKRMVHEVFSQAYDRKLEAGDVKYEWSSASGGLNVCTLTVTQVEGVDQTQWVSSAAPFKRDTQLDCGLKAMDAILTHPVHSAKITLEGKVAIKSSAEKKQKEREARAKARARDDPSGMKTMMKGMMGKGKGKGGSKDGGKGGKGMGMGMMGMGMNPMMMGMVQQMFMKGMMCGKGCKGKGFKSTPY